MERLLLLAKVKSPSEFKDSRFSSQSESDHMSLIQFSGSHSLPINALTYELGIQFVFLGEIQKLPYVELELEI